MTLARKPANVWLPALLGLVALGGPAPAHAQKALSDYVQPELKDLSVSVQVVSRNNRELEKIGKSYVDAYRLDKQEIWAKEPDRIRFQGRQGIAVIRYVTNGDRRLVEVPTLFIRKAEDISKRPAKGDSVADLGVITAAFVAKVDSQWLRTETREGKTLHVFQFSFKAEPEARRTICLDPETKTIVEYIQHHRVKTKPGLRKRLVYSEVKQFNGVSLPTRVTMYNTDGKVAGVLHYDKIKVNSGLQDSLFSF